ncbi:MAG TPA: hypothetical protein VEY90_05280 [Thermoleophilaceae bacterium]|jgi:hypothetical protein|nr:hypothetical protein [Thermoleophilaceae bacterium]
MFASRLRSKVSILAVTALALVALGVTAAVAMPGKGAQQYRANLSAVPHLPTADGNSNASGSAKIVRKGDRLSVLVKAMGLSPGLPHAMHIHGKEAAAEIATCPGADRRDDLVDDGLIETVEGIDDYGPVLVSFTTRGDTSAGSVLALDRFPVARENGSLTYTRRIKAPANLASRLDELHVVVHGHDIDGDGQYGGRTTALGAPLEGELPVACGQIRGR